jgi:hypothetical protein
MFGLGAYQEQGHLYGVRRTEEGTPATAGSSDKTI